MKNGQALHTSPYVTQIEKYADSIKQLSRTFLHLEEKKSAFSNEEIEDMFDRTKKEPAKAVKNVPGAGKRILYIPIRWDMKFYLPSIITGVN